MRLFFSLYETSYLQEFLGFFPLLMNCGRTGTLNRLMGLCQFESAFVGFIPHSGSETAVVYLSAPERRLNVKMRLQLSSVDNPVLYSIPWFI